ncbi:MAG: DUF3108 domain-containing protein [Elusimicrobia bacterium]|nr:DUF3108 domain-containing protein [Elusimicrobiota bacterium]
MTFDEFWDRRRIRLSPMLAVLFFCAAPDRAQISEGPQEPVIQSSSAAQEVIASTAPSPFTGPVFPSPYELVRGPAALPPAAPKVPWYPESLEFEIKWGIISAGWSNLKVQEVVDFAGQSAYHLVSEAQSNKFCDTFYKVRDINESWIHTGNLNSLGYSKKLREGSFFRDEWVTFDYSKSIFTSHKIDRDGTVTPSSGPIPGSVQDMLSSIYFLRPRELKVGDEVILDVNTKSNWPLVVKVIRKENVRVPAGKFSTVLVEPAVRKEGIFIQKGRKLEVWLSDDERHIPVLMRVDVFFGHVSAYLKKIN